MDFRSALRRSGDSLLLVPVNQLTEGPAYEAQVLEARATHARRRNLDEAERAAQEWIQSGQAESRARIALARILLRQGRVAEADAAIRKITGRRARTETTTIVTDRIEIALKLGRGDEALRLADSLRAELDTVPGARGQSAIGVVIFGNFAALDTLIDQIVQAPPAVKAYLKRSVRAQAGLPSDSLFEVEQRFGAMLATAGGAGAAGALLPTLAFTDLRARGSRWPMRPDTASGDTRLALLARVAAGDTNRIRSALLHFDSLIDAGSDESDNGFSLLAAGTHLLLGDSAGALQRLRYFRDVSWSHTPMQEQLAAGLSFSGWIWPHTLQLLGDLAAAQGQRAEAADAYRRFIGMWQRADPEAQPLVQRARNALAQLGN